MILGLVNLGLALYCFYKTGNSKSNMFAVMFLVLGILNFWAFLQDFRII